MITIVGNVTVRILSHNDDIVAIILSSSALLCDCVLDRFADAYFRSACCVFVAEYIITITQATYSTTRPHDCRVTFADLVLYGRSKVIK